MKETTIALENASPGFAELVARARREHTTFVILDVAVPVARLVPTPALRCTAAELARALDTTNLSSEEARAWAEDLRRSRAALNAPEDQFHPATSLDIGISVDSHDQRLLRNRERTRRINQP